MTTPVSSARRLVLFAVLVSAAALAVACGDDDGGATPTTGATATVTTPASPPAEATPPASPTPRPSPTTARSTGNAAVDALIAAVEAKDAAKLASLVEYQELACANVQGAGGPPDCTDMETPGTKVRVMPIATCEGEYHRPESMEAVLKALVTDRDPHLYAVVSTEGLDDPFLPTGSFGLVFDAKAGIPPATGRVLFATDGGKMVSLRTGCPATARELLETLSGAPVVVPPPPQ